MKKSLRFCVLLALAAALLTVSAFADTGPKAQLKVLVKNAPEEPYYLDLLEKGPSIDFLYLRSNHDDALDGENLPNLKTFSKEWTYYRYGKVVFAGIELSGENSLSLYSSLRLGEDDINVVIMHGDISEGAGEDKIKLPLLPYHP